VNSRERVRAIVAGEPADGCGFWLGAPIAETWPILHAYFGTSSEEALRRLLGDDLRWICPQYRAGAYRHPAGREVFDLEGFLTSHGQPGPLAHCTDIRALDEYEWPNPDYLYFDETLQALRDAEDVYRASGMWTPFHHNVMDLFGMEEYLVKMHTHPEVVHSAIERACQFYYEANERFYDQAGDLMDAYFFANDIGTQASLICSPKHFDEFILPWLRQFAAQAHRRGYQVIYHSCGAIYPLIGRLIAAGVDCLHPLQARALNMNAETLSRDFRGRIAFMGGIDTQELLVHGTPEEVKADVRRVKALLGPRLIVSPSHEGVLPDVPPRNIQAMAEAARE
jgi:uroporphyrinogen decarboxylase